MNTVAAELLRNRCQIESCAEILDQYTVLCPRHWTMVPDAVKFIFRKAFRHLQLDRTVDRSTAWSRTVENIGIVEAGNRLGQYQMALELAKNSIKEKIREELCEKIRQDKWHGEKFNMALE